MLSAQQAAAVPRRAHRGLPARQPLNKENLTWAQHKENWAHPASKSRPASAAPAEMAHFSGFVRLLASKDEHQRAILIQRALQQAEAITAAIGPGAAAKGLRRASSADDLRRRPGSPAAEAAGLLTGAVMHEASSMALSETDTSREAERQRRTKEQAAAVRRRKQQARGVAAATVLQAHWRGRQHRRIGRFLRARRTRLRRLDWLDHLEWMRGLLHAHAAASCVQAAWRASRVGRMRPPRPRPVAPPYAPSDIAPPAVQGTDEAPARRSIRWAAKLSEVRQYQIDRRLPVPRE